MIIIGDFIILSPIYCDKIIVTREKVKGKEGAHCISIMAERDVEYLKSRDERLREVD